MQSPEKPAASGKFDLHGVKVSQPGEPLSPDRLAAVERTLGLSLPAEYRSFLLQFNGGIPQPDRFCFTAVDPEDGSRGSRKATVTRFYPATAKESPRGVVQSLEALYKNMTPYGFPNWLVPIAVVDDAVSGGMLCIGVQGKEQGRIYYWPEQEIGEDILHVVADSFGAFLALLR